MQKITPIGENVLLKPEKITEKTEGGFVIPEGSERPALYGTVEGIGGRVEEIEEGQKVAYAKYHTGTAVGEYLLINQADILGIIHEN